MPHITEPLNRVHRQQFAVYRKPFGQLERLSHCYDEKARLRWRIIERHPDHALNVVMLAPRNQEVRTIPGFVTVVAWP